MQMQIEQLRFSRLTAIVLALVIFGAGILVGMSFTGRSAIAGTTSAPPLTAEQMNMGGACPMMKGEAAPADTTKTKAEGACPMSKGAADGKGTASAADKTADDDGCNMDKAGSGGFSMMEHKTDKAAAPAAPAKGAPKATAALYTCPMHADVQSAKPGDCPKCGMALVKKTK
jgi:hypothetical protein